MNSQSIKTSKAAEDFIKELAMKNIPDRESLYKVHKDFISKHHRPFFKFDELLRAYQNLIKNKDIEPQPNLALILRLKKVRSLSGIVVVSVLTKPYPCPGKCLYCPNEKGMPKSYLAKEPAVMRAVANQFHPYKQVINRLKALEAIGHPTDKINIRVIGGTWSYYPKRYQSWFIKECFAACNNYSKRNKAPKYTLLKAQKDNEIAKCRVVELSIETRQDFINIKEIKRLRNLGVTKVELGVQSIYNEVLKLNQRGHNVAKTIKATRLLKEAGFKVAYQMMLNLLGSDFNKDLVMMKKLFSSPDFQPDALKIYPLALIKDTPLYRKYRAKLKIYSKGELIDLIKAIKSKVPYYCRIERVIRDIPSGQIAEGGAKVSNLRQLIADEMTNEKKSCRCIRCREVKDTGKKDDKLLLYKQEYQASGGREIFLSYETKNRQKLYCLLRLRIPDAKKHWWSILNKAALIREIHTYGQQLTIGERNNEIPQHTGLGKKLIAQAEKMSREAGMEKIAAIAGVGVRNYFQKLGYELKQTYMVKDI